MLIARVIFILIGIDIDLEVVVDCDDFLSLKAIPSIEIIRSVLLIGQITIRSWAINIVLAALLGLPFHLLD
jgi:hypothetical protein